MKDVMELEQLILALKSNIVCNAIVCEMIKDMVMFKPVEVHEINYGKYLIGYLDGFKVIMDSYSSLMKNIIFDSEGNELCKVNIF